ncbi:MAG: hypothetical protein IKM86_05470 [Acidaminococcaceae bacterium]|nr:hypothetical protein [Acidaminococcaceae bacterium]
MKIKKGGKDMNCARINKILIPLAAIMCVIAAVTVMMPSPPVVNPDAPAPRIVLHVPKELRPPNLLITLEKPDLSGGIALQG